MSVELKYLQSLEFSMGNGQCPECNGASKSWHGHPCYPGPETIGHEADCPLAAAIQSSGGAVVFKGQLEALPLGDRYKKGSMLYAMRHSAEYKAWKKRMNDEFDDLIIKIITEKD
ncbi:MAG: hypothetical protein JRG81_00020 [Deltaproteobacteria bacterium]|nr:hypothetical protein [Deltaproteobacteria bacterium]MBW2363463.1 hypothetical protein [Deltaproteobacteria bacterium]